MTNVLAHPSIPSDHTPNVSAFSTCEQQEFLDRAFSEAAVATDSTRILNGPRYGEFTTVLEDIDSRLTAIHADLTPDYLKPVAYRPDEATEDISRNGRFDRVAADIACLRYLKSRELQALGRQFGKEAQAESCENLGSIDPTPYHFQGEDPSSLYSTYTHYNPHTTCFNACFRMVFAGITGVSIRETDVIGAVVRAHGETLIEDNEYLKVFNTPAFQEMFDHVVQTISITGAELSTIGKIASKFREKTATRKIFAVISLGSEGSDKNIWHTNALVTDDQATVTVHDPSFMQDRRRENRLMDKKYFYERWAVALNRVHLFIVS